METTLDPTKEYEYAGFWVRFVASIIDTIIFWAITIPILLYVYGNAYWDNTFVAGWVDFWVSWVFPAVAIIALWQWKQATPGKMAIRAIIVDAQTGRKPTLGQWVIRYLGYFVSLIPLGLGYLWVAWDPRKQGWHDKMAGTVVIRDVTQLAPPPFFQNPDQDSGTLR